ncbi:hypothetical protein CF326_g4238 [Tilletia indica]|nr:hypothetical protein CF326_g4238 [Tilletia indica]
MGSSSSDRSVEGPDSDPLLHFGFGWETMEPETQFGWEPYPLSEEREIFLTREVRNLLSLGSLDAQEDRLLRFYRTLMGYFHGAAQTAVVNHRLLEEVRDDNMDLQRVQGDLRRQLKASEDLVSTLRFELQDARRASVEPASPPSCPPSNISSPHRAARVRTPSVSYSIPSPPASRPVGSSGLAADIRDIGDRDPSPRPSSADNVVPGPPPRAGIEAASTKANGTSGSSVRLRRRGSSSASEKVDVAALRAEIDRLGVRDAQLRSENARLDVAMQFNQRRANRYKEYVNGLYHMLEELGLQHRSRQRHGRWLLQHLRGELLAYKLRFEPSGVATDMRFRWTRWDQYHYYGWPANLRPVVRSSSPPVLLLPPNYYWVPPSQADTESAHSSSDPLDACLPRDLRTVLTSFAPTPYRDPSPMEG